MRSTAIMTVHQLIQPRKYEVLLAALIQHLFVGIFLSNLSIYTRIIWPINMLVLGIASIGIFSEKRRWKNRVRDILFLFVLLLPIGLPFFGYIPAYFFALNGLYVAFFIFIFLEVINFLIRPSYINTDIISAAACGFFLLIEMAVFLLQAFQYVNPGSFRGIDRSSPASTFIDLVYFSCITITSIGFGDITPNTYQTKLITSLFGVVGQFYTVVLVGILISKFTSKTTE
ncbi:putative ion transport protein [Fibrella aestuarina BUZ 2]|uniref:Putative ion transport protein n=1 Tax=Fibrella aestuarina BUZ 2 TaxID=1166018 RepID=I0KC68_9BACT|nr:potassium channel family protein [Fibrella aestuarina]CCH01721.1 putative ion transport protein [Fibrella aestuarina BUZ 2]